VEGTLALISPQFRAYRAQLLRFASFLAIIIVGCTPLKTQCPPRLETSDGFRGPIVISAGGVYSGNWESRDPNVPAVSIRTDQPVTIQNATIRSQGHLIQASWVNTHLTIHNTTGHAIAPTTRGRTAGRFLHAEGYQHVTITNSYMEGTAGIYLNASQPGATVKILRNQALNIDGRKSDGAGAYDGFNRVQFVQFNNGNQLFDTEIAWNEIINQPFHSRVEDVINIFQTSGTPHSPIRIHNNYIHGAYPADPTRDTYSGGGIMLGDVGGAHIHAYQNHVISTSNYGIAISGGHHNKIRDNRVISCGRLPDGTPIASQNVGIYIWNMRNEATFEQNTGQNNAVAWINASNRRNDWWTPDAAEWKDNSRLASGSTAFCDEEGVESSVWLTKVQAAGVAIGPASDLLATATKSSRY
jgi:hypothetical protein